MAFGMDPQVLAGLAPLLEAAAAAAPPPAGDYQGRRDAFAVLFAHLNATRAPITGVEVTTRALTTEDGTELELRWYAGDGEQPGSAVLYLHGGGMILGNLDMYDEVIKGYVAGSGVPMLAVEYRLAPEHPDPVPVEDCYAALLWLAQHAAELGVDAARVAVMGDSAGGGLAAGVALVARDRGGPALAQQILVYPMLDDRNTTPDKAIEPFLTWTYDDNVTGWGCLLEGNGKEQVSPYAAPARATDVHGLPPTLIDVGELDIFRDEDLDYARRLVAADVSTEFVLYPGCPHGFEFFAPEAEVSRRALENRCRRLAQL